MSDPDNGIVPITQPKRKNPHGSVPRRSLADPTHPINIDRKFRQRQALELRRDGKSYREIAEIMDYADHTGAMRAVKAGLESIPREPAQDVLTLELERIDIAVEALMPKVKIGDVRAIDRLIKLMDRRAAYLGLNAPKTVDLRVSVREEAQRLAQEYGIEGDLINELIIEAHGVVKDEGLS